MTTGGFAGVDLGGTYIKVAVSGQEGPVLKSRVLPTPSESTPLDVTQLVVRALNGLAAETAITLLGVGMGVPGRVDERSGTTGHLPNLSAGWAGFALRDALQPALGCAVRLMNDARLATLGELVFGRGRGLDRPTFALLTLGTGVGGGFVVRGQLVLGIHGAAGEVGHLVVDANGPCCSCGSHGCLEVFAGARALVELATRRLPPAVLSACVRSNEHGESLVDLELVGRAAARGERAARLVIEEWASWVGLGVANVVNLLDPQFVVLAGGLSRLGEPLFSTVRQVLKERVRMVPTDELGVVPSLLGDQAGIFGALTLARDNERILETAGEQIV